MGSSLSAACPCGYSGKASIGSSRRDHGKRFDFPHECTDCKEVTTVDLLQTPPVCFKCNGTNVTLYGFVVKHVPHGRWNKVKSWFDGSYKREKEGMALLERPRAHENYCYKLDSTFAMKTGPAKCPVCSKPTLIFSLEALFD
jgi:Zn finger protein HypA/HybF involved in hydrogenase expression